jgi:hypothetical protein
LLVMPNISINYKLKKKAVKNINKEKLPLIS